MSAAAHSWCRHLPAVLTAVFALHRRLGSHSQEPRWNGPNLGEHRGGDVEEDGAAGRAPQAQDARNGIQLIAEQRDGRRLSRQRTVHGDKAMQGHVSLTVESPTVRNHSNMQAEAIPSQSGWSIPALSLNRRLTATLEQRWAGSGATIPPRARQQLRGRPWQCRHLRPPALARRSRRLRPPPPCPWCPPCTPPPGSRTQESMADGSLEILKPTVTESAMAIGAGGGGGGGGAAVLDSDKGTSSAPSSQKATMCAVAFIRRAAPWPACRRAAARRARALAPDRQQLPQ